MPLQYLRAALAYFALVFGAGFVLGAIRVPFLVPRVGLRMAELMEMPIMLAVTVLAARVVVRRYGLPSHASVRLMVGVVALALLVAAELGLAILVFSRSPAQYLTGRDPVSGPVYFALLVLFAFMPWLLAWQSRRQGRG